MKRIVILITSLILISNCALSQFNLTIEITGLRNNTGKILLQLFDEKEKVIYREISAVIDKKCSVTVKNLSPGKYAVRYYHDENLNSTMETNMVGKPTEGYGFSNNVTGKFGAPPFEKWLFELKEDRKIVLKINY